MVKRNTSQDERALADRLKREAEASRPAFCEALHAKICRAVASTTIGPGRPPVERRGKPATSRRHRAYAAVAAACAVSVLLVVWQAVNSPQTPTDPPPVADQLPRDSANRPSESPADLLADFNALVDLTGGAPQRVEETVESTLFAGQWAYLDHDARLAASLLIDPLPLEVLASAGEL